MDATTELQDYRQVESVEDIISDDFVIVPLRFEFDFQGTKFKHLKIRCPNSTEMDIMEDEKLSEKKRLQKLLTKVAVEPPLSPDSVGMISYPDFILIQKALINSGFLGMVKKMN
jgi:hypothetical protein